ncbi:hypothetical protein [Promicromonospora soli]
MPRRSRGAPHLDSGGGAAGDEELHEVGVIGKSWLPACDGRGTTPGGRERTGGFRIPVIALKVRGEVEVIDAETFAVIAKTVKEICLISKVLGGVGEITLDVALES